MRLLRSGMFIVIVAAMLLATVQGARAVDEPSVSSIPMNDPMNSDTMGCVIGLGGEYICMGYSASCGGNAISEFTPGNGSYTAVGPNPFDGNDGGFLSVYDGSIYAVDTNFGNLTRINESDLSDQVDLGDYIPGGNPFLRAIQASLYGGVIYVVASGYGGTGVTEITYYDIGSDQWGTTGMVINSSLWDTATGQYVTGAACEIRPGTDEMWCAGGWDTTGGAGAIKEGFVYDIGLNQTTYFSFAEAGPRAGTQMIWSGDVMYLAGGDDENDVPTDTIWYYDPNTLASGNLTAVLPESRTWMGQVHDGNSVYLVGGYVTENWDCATNVTLLDFTPPAPSCTPESLCEVNITECGDYNQSNTIYTVQNEINSSTGSLVLGGNACIYLSDARNVTLDCQGNLIDRNDMGTGPIFLEMGAGTGSNATVRNCNMNVYADYLYSITIDGNVLGDYLIENNNFTLGAGQYVEAATSYSSSSSNEYGIIRNNIVNSVSANGIVFDVEGYGDVIIYNNSMNISSNPNAIYLTVYSQNAVFTNSTVGNLYLNDAGTGFSETCVDANSDGVCDATYDVSGTGYVDEVPIALEAGQFAFDISGCRNITENGTYTVTNSFYHSGGDPIGCIIVNVAPGNVTIDGAGYTITTNATSGAVIYDLSASDVLTVKNLTMVFDTGSAMDSIDSDAADVVIEDSYFLGMDANDFMYVSGGMAISRSTLGRVYGVGDVVMQDSYVYEGALNAGALLYAGGLMGVGNTTLLANGSVFFGGAAAAIFDGNMYLAVNGTGFSQTCVDANYDGVCDASYDVDGSGYVDATPQAFAIGQNVQCLPETPCVISSCKNITSPGYYVVQSFEENFSGRSCINITLSGEDITIEGNGSVVDATAVSGISGLLITVTDVGNINVSNLVASLDRSGVGSDRLFGPGDTNVNLFNVTLQNVVFVVNSSSNCAVFDGVSTSQNIVIENSTLRTECGGGYNYFIGDSLVINNSNIECVGGSSGYGCLEIDVDTIMRDSYVYGLDGAFDVYSPINMVLVNNTFNASTYFSDLSGSPTMVLNDSVVGNMWVNSSGDAFSQTCYDLNFDGICDAVYDVEGSGYVDYLPRAIIIGQNAPEISAEICAALTYPNEDDLPAAVTIPVNFSVFAPLGFSSPSVAVTLKLGGDAYTGTCAETVVDGQNRNYSCNVTMHYWYGAGNYDLNVTFTDGVQSDTVIDSGLCEYGQLLASQRTTMTVTFPSAAPGVANSPGANPVVLRNTGNMPLDLSMTAYDLQSRQNPATILEASTFKAGKTLGTAVTMADGVTKNLSMTVEPANGAYENVSMWLSIPSSQPIQDYFSPIAWQVVVTG